jgi:hypothetical protein
MQQLAFDGGLGALAGGELDAGGGEQLAGADKLV